MTVLTATPAQFWTEDNVSVALTSNDLTTITPVEEGLSEDAPGFNKRDIDQVFVGSRHGYQIAGLWRTETANALRKGINSGYKILAIEGTGDLFPVAGDYVDFMHVTKTNVEQNGSKNNILGLTVTFALAEDGVNRSGQLVLPHGSHADRAGAPHITVGSISLVKDQQFYIVMWGEDGADARDSVDLLLQSSGGGSTISTGTTLAYNDKGFFVHGPVSSTTDGTLQYTYSNVSANARTFGVAIVYDR